MSLSAGSFYISSGTQIAPEAVPPWKKRGTLQGADALYFEDNFQFFSATGGNAAWTTAGSVAPVAYNGKNVACTTGAVLNNTSYFYKTTTFNTNANCYPILTGGRVRFVSLFDGGQDVEFGSSSAVAAIPYTIGNSTVDHATICYEGATDLFRFGSADGATLQETTKTATQIFGAETATNGVWAIVFNAGQTDFYLGKTSLTLQASHTNNPATFIGANFPYFYAKSLDAATKSLYANYYLQEWTSSFPV